jgi:hypothetical protein
MNLRYKELLPPDFNADSHVWIYQGSRLFTISEALEIETRLNDFVAGWNSHGVAVKGFASLFFGQFIVLMADETATGVSGCSTDSSVRLVKEIGEKYQADFFDRLSLAFFVKDKIQRLPLSQLPYAAENSFISRDTLYFNNTVQTKKELEERWLVPVSQSWLKDRMQFSEI